MRTLPPPLRVQMPGGSHRLLQELLVRLSCSNDPSLALLHASAAGLFSGGTTLLPVGGGAGAALAGGTLGSGSGHSNHHPHPPHHHSPLRPPARVVPELGSLGEFLLGRWQEEEAHERVLLARGSAMLQQQQQLR